VDFLSHALAQKSLTLILKLDFFNFFRRDQNEKVFANFICGLRHHISSLRDIVFKGSFDDSASMAMFGRQLYYRKLFFSSCKISQEQIIHNFQKMSS
jgi:hypothetical protein